MDAGTGALINATQPLPEAAQNPAGSLAELCGGFVSTCNSVVVGQLQVVEEAAEELLKGNWAALENANEVVEDAVGSAVKTIQEFFGDEQLLLCLHIDLRYITVFDSRPSMTHNSLDCGAYTTQYIYSKGTVVMYLIRLLLLSLRITVDARYIPSGDKNLLIRS